LKSTDPFFIPFELALDDYAIPSEFSLMTDAPHSLCLLAAHDLQSHLKDQNEWAHNFGLENDAENIIGKMFGVMVVRTKENEIGYLSAFSGKLAKGNHHSKFVPPVFDLLTEKSFVNLGMQELTRINKEIETLKDPERIEELKNQRKNNSIALQNKIFDQYHFLNRAGKLKSLIELFKEAGYKNCVAGAGECAGPKLLQYAFLNKMQPLALAEFWWGLSPKSDTWKHGHFYPCCKEKCEPILAHMLSGINVTSTT
jgi:tRNA pseudouridine32 synthase/23S rRNA pseudouridine746 synthase